MEQSQMKIDLSALIEWKINERNKLAQRRPRPDGIVSILDREIDILERIEIYIDLMEQKHAKAIIETNRKAFGEGITAGIMQERTGRYHSQQLIRS